MIFHVSQNCKRQSKIIFCILQNCKNYSRRILCLLSNCKSYSEKVLLRLSNCKDYSGNLLYFLLNTERYMTNILFRLSKSKDSFIKNENRVEFFGIQPYLFYKRFVKNNLFVSLTTRRIIYSYRFLYSLLQAPKLKKNPRSSSAFGFTLRYST